MISPLSPGRKEKLPLMLGSTSTAVVSAGEDQEIKTMAFWLTPRCWDAGQRRWGGVWGRKAAVSWSLLILLCWESILIYLRIWRQDRRLDERARTVYTQSKFVGVSLTKYICLDASISQKRHRDDGRAASISLLAIERRLDPRHFFPPPPLGPRRQRCAWPFR